MAPYHFNFLYLTVRTSPNVPVSCLNSRLCFKKTKNNLQHLFLKFKLTSKKLILITNRKYQFMTRNLMSSGIGLFYSKKIIYFSLLFPSLYLKNLGYCFEDLKLFPILNLLSPLPILPLRRQMAV